ncbi:hypothetical protein ABPG72_004745 [Tetrahymena utriculariae]
MQIKFFTSQYNISSQQKETQYRSTYINLQGYQFKFVTINIIKQETTIKQGILFQQSTKFTSLKQYNPTAQTFQRQNFIEKTGLTLIMHVILQVDEIVEQIQIQYPTITQVFAQSNSVITILLLFGIVGRPFSAKHLQEDLFFLLLQNVYLNDYQKICESNKITQKRDDQLINQIIIERKERNTCCENETIFSEVPQFHSRLKQCLDIQQSQLGQSINSNQQIRENKQDEYFQNLQKSQQTNFYNENALIQNKLNQIQDSSPLASLYIQERLRKNSLIKSNSNQSIEKCIQQIQKERNSKQYKLNRKLYYYFKFWNRDKIIENSGIDVKTIQVIQEQVSRTSNILQLISDIIYLKKMIMILLSREQLASFNLVGLSGNFGEDNCDKSNKQANYIKSENYFENQFILSQSKDLQYKYVNKFLRRCCNSQNVSQIDMRIISSLNKTAK